jgi:hypothetical protein
MLQLCPHCLLSGKWFYLQESGFLPRYRSGPDGQERRIVQLPACQGALNLFSGPVQSGPGHLWRHAKFFLGAFCEAFVSSGAR